MGGNRITRRLAVFLSFPIFLGAQAGRYNFEDAQRFLKTNCQACHQGNSPAGGFGLQQVATPASLKSDSARWNKLALRVHNGEMPPKPVPVPPVDQREEFSQWVIASVHEAVCAV